MTDLTRDKLIEAMARDSWEAGGCLSWDDDVTVGPYRDGWRKRQAAALDAIGALAAVVPREADEEMLMAAQNAPTAFEAYPLMVAVADLSRPALSEEI